MGANGPQVRVDMRMVYFLRVGSLLLCGVLLVVASNSVKAASDPTTSLSDARAFIFGNQSRPLVVTAESGGIIATSTTSDDVRYVLSDHLGSTRVVVDEAGETVASFDYSPTGETRRSDGKTTFPYLFGGQLSDAALGTTHYPLREYDPILGRFLSVDPHREGSSSYVFAANDPVNNVDPLGGEVRRALVILDRSGFPQVQNARPFRHDGPGYLDMRNFQSPSPGTPSVFRDPVMAEAYINGLVDRKWTGNVYIVFGPNAVGVPDQLVETLSVFERLLASNLRDPSFSFQEYGRIRIVDMARDPSHATRLSEDLSSVGYSPEYISGEFMTSSPGGVTQFDGLRVGDYEFSPVQVDQIVRSAMIYQHSPPVNEVVADPSTTPGIPITNRGMYGDLYASFDDIVPARSWGSPYANGSVPEAENPFTYSEQAAVRLDTPRTPHTEAQAHEVRLPRLVSR